MGGSTDRVIFLQLEQPPSAAHARAAGAAERAAGAGGALALSPVESHLSALIPSDTPSPRPPVAAGPQQAAPYDVRLTSTSDPLDRERLLAVIEGSGDGIDGLNRWIATIAPDASYELQRQQRGRAAGTAAAAGRQATCEGPADTDDLESAIGAARRPGS